MAQKHSFLERGTKNPFFIIDSFTTYLGMEFRGLVKADFASYLFRKKSMVLLDLRVLP